MNKIRVLSLFDGLGGARLALHNSGISCDYYASEVDKYAIKIAQKNFPDIIQLGDIRGIDGKDFINFDLIIGGSPCQDLSCAGKAKGLKGNRSILFYEFVRILREANPKYFVLENVASMKKENKDIITKELGIEPVCINSSLLTAQNRKRLYWTNIEGIEQPEDRKIFWKDVIEQNSLLLPYSHKGLDWIKRHGKRKNKTLRIYCSSSKKKMQCLESTMYKNYSSERFFAIKQNGYLRYISPIECERLQGIPDNYTEDCSNTQRYKMLGNSFTISIIGHILSYAKF